MGQWDSRRFRVRMSYRDGCVLSELLRLTQHATKSDVARSALLFYRQVRNAEREGFEIVFRHRASADERSLSSLDEDAPRGGDLAGAKEERGLSLELRLRSSEADDLAALVRSGGGKTRSEATRQAIRLYFRAVTFVQRGYAVLAKSRFNEILHIPVRGVPDPGVDGEAKAGRAAEYGPSNAREASTAGREGVEEDRVAVSYTHLRAHET